MKTVPLLEVKNLKTYYFTSRGVVKAVDDINLRLNQGTALGVSGESGCGKSSIVYSVMRIIPPPGQRVYGQILLGDIDITEISEKQMREQILWKRISMVFQAAMNAHTPVYTIGRQIVEVLTHHANISKADATNRMKQLLELVGLESELAKRYPHELSGGQKQRAFIAMALALNPDVLIADEPTTALDVVVQAQILNLLKRLVRDLKMSLILIASDLSVIAEIADSVAIMYAGKVVEKGPADSFFSEPSHPYAQGLLRSVPRLEKTEKVGGIPGFPPDLINPPSGCRFEPRCPHSMDICKKQEPTEKCICEEHFVSCWLYSR